MARKPLSVWIAQILIGLAWALFTGAFAYYAALSWPVIVKAIAPYPQALVMFAARTLLTVALIVLVGWTIVMISRRSPWGDPCYLWQSLQEVGPLPAAWQSLQVL